MNRSLAVAILLASASVASAAEPQVFAGDCKPFKGAAECGATQWCHWVAPKKQITLPDGSQFARAPFCGFKSGFKAAWLASKK